ncbi:Chromatin assembly factor 1 subunit rlf2 [Drechslerella dactyloides]|uniref:Chromatin assembly factor 1 subunit rlf2 n=1 Tax=Drechslerella dactyloides TaxID=74499 RepID=A0AAD6J3T0_DREDA|nr:Chromatin assembly factor 1 subunit rlf2 [Drechslerella dactyloides]
MVSCLSRPRYCSRPGMASEPLAAESLPATEATSKMSNLGLGGSPADPPPAKKRTKLSADEKAEREKEKAEREKEKEEKRKEREEKEKEKAKIKAEKEEQKRTKEEEKAKKDAERAAEKAKRDEEKAKKDEEKARKEEEKVKREEEKAKKERAQLRMDTFFMKKSVPTTSTGSSAPTKPPATSYNGTSLPPPPNVVSESPLPQSNASQPLTCTAPATKDVEMIDRPAAEKPDFVKYFHPFFARPGVTVAPPHSFGRDEDATSYIREKLDRDVLKRPRDQDEMDVDEAKFQIPNPLPPTYFEEIFALPPAKRRKRGNLPKFSTRDILAGLNRSPEPIPQFSSKETVHTNYVTQLKKLPRKVLKYCEDIRPAYSGTFTRIPKTSGLRKGRNPFQKSLPGVNYDYDSEAEWVEEPDEDGEELLSEEEDDPMDIGSPDEMDDFLDDEPEDPGKKRHNVSGPLIPTTTGIMWEGECAKIEELERFRMGILTVGHVTPIDPFSIKYWEQEKKKAPAFFQAPSLPSNKTAASGNRPPVQTLPSANGPTLARDVPHPQAAAAAPATPNPLESALQDEFGRFYTDYASEPILRTTFNKCESGGTFFKLGDLADPRTAVNFHMSQDDNFTFFKLLHKIPILSHAHLVSMVGFVEKNDRSKLGLLEEAKRESSSTTSADVRVDIGHAASSRMPKVTGFDSPGTMYCNNFRSRSPIVRVCDSLPEELKEDSSDLHIYPPSWRGLHIIAKTSSS